MAISFVRYQGSIHLTVDAGDEGQTETLIPRVAGALFAESHMPAVGDIIRFVTPGDGPPYVPSRKTQGQDLPKTLSFGQSPTTYEFACSNGTSEWTVTAVGQDDSVTMMRGQT